MGGRSFVLIKYFNLFFTAFLLRFWSKIFHRNSSGERRLTFIGERIAEDKCEANRTSLSTTKATSSTQWPQTCTELGSDRIIQFQCKRNRWREGTPTADASKSDVKIRQRLKFTVKIIFFDAAIGRKSYTISTMHVKNIFPTDSGVPISLYTMSNNGFDSKLYFTMNSLEHALIMCDM